MGPEIEPEQNNSSSSGANNNNEIRSRIMPLIHSGAAPLLHKKTPIANQPNQINALAFSLFFAPVIYPLQQKNIPQRRMLEQLNDQKFTAPEGGTWVLSQLQKVLVRINLNEIALKLVPHSTLNAATSEVIIQAKERLGQINDLILFNQLMMEVGRLAPDLSPETLQSATEFQRCLIQAGVAMPACLAKKQNGARNLNTPSLQAQAISKLLEQTAPQCNFQVKRIITLFQHRLKAENQIAQTISSHPEYDGLKHTYQNTLLSHFNGEPNSQANIVYQKLFQLHEGSSLFTAKYWRDSNHSKPSP